MDKPHLYEDSKGILHSAQGSHIGSRTYIAFTKCGFDIPANKSFRSFEDVTCATCKERVEL